MTSVLQQHRLHKRKRFIHKIFSRFLVFLASLALVAVVLLFLPQLSFRKIHVSGNTTVASADIMQISERMLEEKILYVLPRRNIFLFRPHLLEGEVRSAFPLLSEVNVSGSLWGGVAVAVSEREQWGVYCKAIFTENQTTPSSGCFYIAADGVLFAEAPTLMGNAMFRIIDMRAETKELKVGDHGIAKEFISPIRDVAAWFSDRYQGVIQEAIIGRPYESDMELGTDEGWYIRLDKETCTACALDDLAVVFEKQIKDRANLEYVDVRFNGKVFYKSIR